MLALSLLHLLSNLDDAALRKIAGRQVHHHFVSDSQCRQRVPQAAGAKSPQAVAIGQFHPERPVGLRFHYPTFKSNGVFAGQVRISGSDSVINTVCSK
jgi:hypothetical protein